MTFELPDAAKLWPEEDVKEYQTYARKTIIKTNISMLEAGGEQAVKVMSQFATARGEELTASDIELAYRSQIS